MKFPVEHGFLDLWIICCVFFCADNNTSGHMAHIGVPRSPSGGIGSMSRFHFFLDMQETSQIPSRGRV